MSTYETLRHFADTWGLVGLVLVFAFVVIRAFLPRLSEDREEAANSIFRHENRPATDREEA